MKKVVFALAVCMFAGGLAFGQKKVVSRVKSDIKAATPNIAEARASIKAALTDPETANSAEAWFVAGQVEEKQFELEQAKEFVGAKPNQDLMYPALDAIWPYFQKAYELDQLPNEKGKVKPKFVKDIKTVMQANRPYYTNAGIYFFEKKNYQKAYECFKMVGDIPDLPMFAEDGSKLFPKPAAGVIDTFAIETRANAGLAASLVPNYPAAIEVYEELKDQGYNEQEFYQRLAELYRLTDQKEKFIATLEAGNKKFPADYFFISSLVDNYLQNNRVAESLDYLDKAIALTSDPKVLAQMYNAKAFVYEKTNDLDKAIEFGKKAVENNAEDASLFANLGRYYYNSGVNIQNASENLKGAESVDAKAKYEALFREAIPCFEKAYELNPEDKDAVYALRNMCYILGDSNYDKWDEIYKSL